MNSNRVRQLVAIAGLAVSLLGIAGLLAQERLNTLHIELPVKNNQYDATPLNLALSKKVSKVDSRAWFPLTTRTRLALTLLESEGTIASFRIDDDRLTIDFNRAKLADVQKALFPPRLLGDDNLNNKSKLVLFIHGLEGSESNFSELAPAFAERGWLPLQLVYPNDGDIHKPALFLRNELKRLHTKHPTAKIVVIAHSLGGLVAWDALADPKTRAAGSLGRSDETGVTDFVTLGTPFGGSGLARFQSELELWEVANRILSREWLGLDITRDGEGEAIEILAPLSDARRDLLVRELPDSIQLHVAIGDSGPVAPDDQAKFASLIERLINKNSLDNDFAANLRYLATAPELVTGTGDGAVTVDSAKAIKEYASLRVFHRSHIGLLQLTGNEPNEVLNWMLDKIAR